MDAGSQERMATTRAGKADSKLISMIPFLPESASKTKIFHLSRQNRASLLRSKLQCKVNLTHRERERERDSADLMILKTDLEKRLRQTPLVRTQEQLRLDTHHARVSRKKQPAQSSFRTHLT